MFQVLQVRAYEDRGVCLRGGCMRTVYSVDSAGNRFLVGNDSGGFSWIPMHLCRQI